MSEDYIEKVMDDIAMETFGVPFMACNGTEQIVVTLRLIIREVAGCKSRIDVLEGKKLN